MKARAAIHPMPAGTYYALNELGEIHSSGLLETQRDGSFHFAPPTAWVPAGESIQVVLERPYVLPGPELADR